MAKRYETFFRDIDINWDSNLYHFIARLILAFNFIDILFLDCAGILLQRTNFLLSLELVLYLFYSLLSMVKTSTFIFQEEKHRSLAEQMNKLREGNAKDDQYVQSVHGNARLFAKVWNTLMVSGMVFMLALALIQTPISIAMRQLLFNGYYMYDVTATPYYEVTVLFRTSVVVLNIGAFTVCDTSLIVTLIDTIVQFKILRHNIRHVRDHAAQKVKKEMSACRPRGLRSLVEGEGDGQDGIPLQVEEFEDDESSSVESINGNRWQRSSIAEAHDVMGEGAESWPHRERGEVFDVEAQITQGTLRLQHISQQQQQQLQREREVLTNGRASLQSTDSHCLEESLKAMKLAINREMEVELTNCVKHHQELTSFIGDVEAAFNAFFMIQLLSNLVLTGDIAMYFTLASELDIKVLLLTLLLLCCVGELFIFCELASEITRESGAVKDSVYESDWLDASEGFKRSMRVIISRSNNPIVMKAAWYIPLSMETFWNVCHTAFSYYRALRTVSKKQ